MDVREGPSYAESEAAMPVRCGRVGLPVAFANLTYTVKSRKEKRDVKLLDNVSGLAEAQQLLAIMGPSGSGKTTLLDVLAMRKTAGTVSGEVRFGRDKPTAAFLRRYTGYVEQCDTLIPNLTVAETLMYTAELKRSTSEPRAVKRELVQQLLERLGLTACADVAVGEQQLTTGISGGEAKRTSIGIALISDPRVLFLDEPTSGLDSCHTKAVVRVMHALAREGTTVVATIHSPSATAFALFDAVMMLVKGSIVFFGPREASLAFARQHWASLLDVPLPLQDASAQLLLAEVLVDAITDADKAGRAAELAAAYQASALCRENELKAATYIAAPDNPKVAVEMAKQDSSQLVAPTVTALLTPAASASAHDLCSSPTGDSAALAGAHTDACGDSSTACAATQGDEHLATATCSGTSTPWWWALLILLKYRTGRNVRNPVWIAARTADKVFIGAVIISLYVGTGDDFDFLINISAALFMWCGLPAFGAMAYMPSIIGERKLFYRERSDGLYTTATYLVAKLLEEFSMSVMATAPLAAAIFYSVRYQGSFALFWLTCLFTHTVGIALSYLVGALVPTMDMANALLPAYVTGLLFMAGQLAAVDTIPVWWRWFGTIDFVRWAWFALMANQFSEQNPPADAQGTPILEFYSISPGRQWEYFALLFPFFAAYALLAYLALAFVRHGAR